MAQETESDIKDLGGFQGGSGRSRMDVIWLVHVHVKSWLVSSGRDSRV